MNFAVPFVRGFKYLDQENVQYNIKYKPKIKELDNFLSVYGSHRINLMISEIDPQNDFKILNALKEKYPDTKLVLCISTYKKEIEQILNENNFLHYYNELVTSWDKFHGFLKLNVTDIFVAEDLCFSCEALSYNAKEKNIELRVYCNVCQSSWNETPSLKTFFIRPEDISLYAKYIDTFEFYANELDTTRINTLYQIYAKDQEWHGNLKDLIIGYEGEEDSQFLIPRFGEKRLNCNKKCNKNIPPHCFLCDRIAELGKLFKDNDILIKIKKEKEQPNESNKSSN